MSLAGQFSGDVATGRRTASVDRVRVGDRHGAPASAQEAARPLIGEDRLALARRPDLHPAVGDHAELEPRTRDGEQLRAFYNVCLHRAGPVASGCGKRNTLQCRYHGGTYGLDGTLQRTPGMEGTTQFRPDEMGLVPVAVTKWGAVGLG